MMYNWKFEVNGFIVLLSIATSKQIIFLLGQGIYLVIGLTGQQKLRGQFSLLHQKVRVSQIVFLCNHL